MNNPKFREKVLIGLENAPPTFNVRGKVVGPNGANLQYITNETGAIVTIRGRGSGYIEPNTGQESIEPLHICIEHSKYEVLQAGRQLAFNLIDTVQQEWANLQHQLQQEQQPQQQQPQQQQPHHQPLPPQQQQPQQLQQLPQPQQPPPQQSLPPPPQQPQQVPSVVSSSGAPAQGLVSSEVVPSVAMSATSVVPSHSSAGVGLPAGFTQQVGQMITVPPPTHVSMPPPTLQIPSQIAQQQDLDQVLTQVATSTSNGSLVGHSGDGNQTLVPGGTQGASQEAPVSQASTHPPSITIPAQQQLFLSNQGTLIQPQTLIPQQQQIITPTGQVIAAQPQVLAQSYLLQYMQTNSGQMVVSYPNIVRPSGGATDPMRGQQLMLVQYGEGGTIKTGAMRAPAPQPPPAAVPQMVQIVNPQTGQVQHVLQHIQPQIQMQQAALQPQLVGGGGGLLGQQVLMPIQAPIQFTSQPQQMIIAQPPPQLQQQILPSGQTVQHVIPTSTLNQVNTPVSINVSQKQIVLNIAKQQQQGLKRRYEGDPQQLSIMDANTAQQLQNKKGIGNLWLVSTADGTGGLAQTVCSPAYRYPTSVNLGATALNPGATSLNLGVPTSLSLGTTSLNLSVPTSMSLGATSLNLSGVSATTDTLLIQSGDLSLQNSQISKADGMPRPPQTPQQEIILHPAEKNHFGQDEWRRNSPLPENSDSRGGDPSAVDSAKRGRMSQQNGQGNEMTPESRSDVGVDRFAQVVPKVEGVPGQPQPQQIYSLAQIGGPGGQPISVGVRQQQQQLYQAGSLSQQQAQGNPAAQQLPPGTYAQQMYPPPPLPSSTSQVGPTPQQYVAPPMYNTMPPQQPYATAPYNPWIMPS